MEEQLSDAYAEVARLKDENDKLASRTSILEKVLALRDDQLQASRGQVRLPLRISNARSLPHSPVQGLNHAVLPQRGKLQSQPLLLRVPSNREAAPFRVFRLRLPIPECCCCRRR